MKTKTIDFVIQTFTRGKLPSMFLDASNVYSHSKILENFDDFDIDSNVVIVEDIPTYLCVNRKEKPKKIKSFTIKQYPGFLINFKGVKSLPEYLKSRFGKTSRYKLRREQRKLEHCFDISYEMYYGEMDKQTYDFVFEEFYRLLEIRSEEKGIKGNANLKYKSEYYEIVHQMILDKKASFFVIYNGKMPIDICLNFHLDKTLFQYIRTYDIAYSKFNTGYTDLMKQIDWCITNKVESISFSKGDFYWKRRWCNTVYDYDYEVFYNYKSIKALIFVAKFTIMKKMRQLSREYGIIEKYHKYRDKKIKANTFFEEANFEIINSEIDKYKDNIEQIDYKLDEFASLRRHIFNFLYAHDEKESGIKIFKFLNAENQYLVIGENTNAIIRL